MKHRRKLKLSDRREQIVRATIPLFARKGFAGTTTREIAEAAGVSEALVFRHFANKTVLYDAILQYFVDTTPAFERLSTLAPSTRNLVRIVRATTDYFATVAADEEGQAGCRLFLRSLSEDAGFASIGIGAYAELRLTFEQCFEAARAAGDLIEHALEASKAFWMIVRQHVMLPGWTLLPNDFGAQVPNEEYVHFILRGIGLKEEVTEKLVAEAWNPPLWRADTASFEVAV
jgi:TetR/AcrR family transcriptional regulator, transcriptional repressor of aconitase